MAVRLIDGVLVNDDDPHAPIAVEEVASGIVDSPDPEYPSEIVCEVCSESIEYGGRGRKPKYHPDCRPTAPKRSAGTPNRGGIRNEAALRDALLARYLQIGSILSMAHPAYGMSIRQKAEKAVNADIEYARVSPAFRRTLESMIEKTALGAVIAVHVSMLAPVFVGENAKRMARRNAKPVAVKAPATPDRPAPPRAAPVPSESSNVYGFPSVESDLPPEVVNAAAMPGMPG
jgi:hypothetical protein